MSQPDLLKKRRGHDAANEQAAAIILADVERAGGERSASVQWARLWRERNPKEENDATK
jgi:hypothetical protein